MRKRVLVILGCVVVGVVANVLVAWVLFWRAQGGSWSEGDVIAGSNTSIRWPCHVPQDWPRQASSQRDYLGLGVKQTQFYARVPAASEDAPLGDPHIGYSVDWQTSGWPLRALAFSSFDVTDWYADSGGMLPTPEAIGVVDIWQRGVELPDWMAAMKSKPLDTCRLPTWPVGLAFVMNTVVYGALAWGVVFAPGVVRRWRRRKRGACLTCGYDLRGGVAGGVCPECGGSGA